VKPRLVMLAFVCALLGTGGAALGQVTVIAAGTVIDGTGREPLTDATIVIEGSRLAEIGPRGTVTVPAGARTIDARGKFIVPGLMDANVHLVLGSSIEFIVRHEGRYDQLIEEAAQVTLSNGLTTVFDSWGPLQPLLDVRDRINRREVPGSRMFAAGNIIGFSGPFGRDFNGDAEGTATKALVSRINRIWEENTGPDLLWMTPDQVRFEVRKYATRGMDFLKYGASGHRLTNLIQFSPETQRAIVEEGHRAGKIVQTHTTSVDSLRQGLEAGVDMMQHAASTGPVPIPDSVIRLALDRKAYLAVQPRTKRRLEIELKRAEEASPHSITRFNERVRHENQERLIKAGVPLLLATDAGMMDPDAVADLSPELRTDRLTELGEGHFLWFRAMVEKGMTPMQAILAATRNVAAAYRVLDRLGTLERGKQADLLVLEANPLTNVENLRRIEMVIKDGHVVDRAQLPLRRVLTRPRSTVTLGKEKTR
jgi:imidazolonepropionase-like amidohydrolase